MKKDLEIIKKIFRDLNYTEPRIDVLIDKIVERFNDSKLDSLTPNLVYYALIFDEGKTKSADISDRYKRKKEFDDDETPIQKWARERGYDK
jgi:hypothetical protein